MKLFGNLSLSKEERIELLRKSFSVQKGFNGFFSSVGTVYRTFEFLFLIIFILFLAVSAVANLGSVSYSGLEYLVRNFAVTLDNNKSTASEITYSPDTDMSFALAGKGLSVAGNTGVYSFSATGRKTLSAGADYINPCVAASEKFTVAYECGGNTYTVYNGFSKVYFAETEYAIYSISVADNGNIAILTRTDTSLTYLSVIDSDFDEIYRIKRNSYTVSAELSSDGEKLVLCELDVNSDGFYSAGVYEYRIGSDSFSRSFEYTGIFPLKACFSGDYTVIVCADRVISVNASGQSVSYIFSEGTLVGFNVSEGYTAVLVENPAGSDEKYSLSISGPDGNIYLHRYTADFSVMSSYGNRAFILTEDGMFTFENGSVSDTIQINQTYTKEAELLPFDRTNLYLATKSAAYVIGVD